MLLYYITDRRQFAGDEQRRRELLLAKVTEAALCGIDFVQLREKDLPPRQLEALAGAAVEAVRKTGAPTRLLINSRTDLALATGADGVHLTSTDVAAGDAGAVWHACAGRQRTMRGITIAVSCHTPGEVRRAEAHGADFAVFAPVFEKVAAPARPPAGLALLREACRGVGAPPNVEGVGAGRMPVLALGGVTLDNARACLQAGAAGIAAIRLFQENEISRVVAALRALKGI
jgi:thiamine-phosphate pyrophosphorylase